MNDHSWLHLECGVCDTSLSWRQSVNDPGQWQAYCARCEAQRRPKDETDGMTPGETVIAVVAAMVAIALFLAGVWYIHDVFKVGPEFVHTESVTRPVLVQP